MSYDTDLQETSTKQNSLLQPVPPGVGLVPSACRRAQVRQLPPEGVERAWRVQEGGTLVTAGLQSD